MPFLMLKKRTCIFKFSNQLSSGSFSVRGHGSRCSWLLSNLTSSRISPGFWVDISKLWMSLIVVHCPSSVGCSLAIPCTPVKNNSPLCLLQTSIAFGGQRDFFTFLKIMSSFLLHTKTHLPKILWSFKSLWPVFEKYGAN